MTCYQQIYFHNVVGLAEIIQWSPDLARTVSLSLFAPNGKKNLITSKHLFKFNKQMVKYTENVCFYKTIIYILALYFSISFHGESNFNTELVMMKILVKLLPHANHKQFSLRYIVASDCTFVSHHPSPPCCYLYPIPLLRDFQRVLRQ